ncbi:MAG: hypothetical protein H7A46_19510 [Verrucomicrobiales bacterium]|nr:hypothetical protein [Verrucomicrobiales bacterium]
MKNRILTHFIQFSLLMGLPVAGAQAQTVRGLNGHFYTLVSAPGITFESAVGAAEATLRCGQPGHLVTLTSQEESDFVVGSFGVAPLATKWLGAYQPVSSDGVTGWAWITGEPFSFTQWNAGEPNNGYYGPFYGYEDAAVFWTAGNWNDAPSGWDYYGGGGYVIEWDVDAAVIIGGCATGVTNAVVDEDTLCTISDLIAECAAEATNHGEFVSCVAHLTNALKEAGLISGEEKGAIQSCAAQAEIP